MRIRLFAALVAIALCAGPAMAQEQRGSIEGIVKDASGGVLPGVTVALAGGSGAKLDTVSDAQGLYRFPSLAPGTYTVTADQDGQFLDGADYAGSAGGTAGEQGTDTISGITLGAGIDALNYNFTEVSFPS